MIYEYRPDRNVVVVAVAIIIGSKKKNNNIIILFFENLPVVATRRNPTIMERTTNAVPR